METLLEVDVDGWCEQLPQMREHYALFGDKLPQDLQDELDGLSERLSAS